LHDTRTDLHWDSDTAVNRVSFVDLFAGLGGFHLAARRLGVECLFASEIDEGLRDLYKKNFGMEPSGDIRGLNVEDVPRHDLLCAGFPCQAFSKAGDQAGFSDIERGSVVYNMLAIVRHHHPRYVLLENVAHFVAHDKGHTFEHVERDLQSMGYATSHAKLSPHQFGVPQIRDRMFMVASRRGLKKFKWPESWTDESKLSIKSVLDSNPTDTRVLSPELVSCIDTWQEFLDLYPKGKKLPSDPIWSMEFGATYPYSRDSLSRVPLDELRRARGACGVPLTGRTRAEIRSMVPSHARAGLHAFPNWKKLFIQHNRELYASNKTWLDGWLPKIRKFPPSWQKFEWNCQGEPRKVWNFVLQVRASGIRTKRPNTAPSLVAMTTTQVPIIGWERRYMTTRECARLQSMGSLRHLPEGGRGYKALGNAVNVKVAELVLRQLLSASTGPARQHCCGGSSVRRSGGTSGG
jgi:DNA (cytosine-5)-methyltransferase 1